MKILHKLTGYRNRYSYWSNSKLSYAIQKTFGMKEQPDAATSKEWRLLGEYNKNVNSVIYWITETGFDKVQNFIYFPVDVYRNFYAKYHNIFVSKMHYIQTKLPLGEYNDCDTRIMHGLMETLVDFVETEKAHMMLFDEEFNEENKNKKLTPRENGLAHLDWEIALKYDESFGIEKDDPRYGKPTTQAHAAQEIKDIYIWWKDIYPNRPDPMDISGWSEHCRQQEEKGYFLLESSEDPEDVKKSRELITKNIEIEDEQFEEDTRMLCRIIKIRNHMWT